MRSASVSFLGLLALMIPDHLLAAEPPLIPASSRLADMQLEPGQRLEYHIEYTPPVGGQTPGTQTVPRIMSIAPIQSEGGLVAVFNDLATGTTVCERHLRDQQATSCVLGVKPGTHTRFQVILQAGATSARLPAITHSATSHDTLARIHPGNGVSVDENPLREGLPLLSGEIMLESRSTLDVHTWGGAGQVDLTVASLDNPDVLSCESGGDLWRHCRISDAPAGRYGIFLSGDVHKANLMTRW